MNWEYTAFSAGSAEPVLLKITLANLRSNGTCPLIREKSTKQLTWKNVQKTTFSARF